MRWVKCWVCLYVRKWKNCLYSGVDFAYPVPDLHLQSSASFRVLHIMILVCLTNWVHSQLASNVLACFCSSQIIHLCLSCLLVNRGHGHSERKRPLTFTHFFADLNVSLLRSWENSWKASLPDFFLTLNLHPFPPAIPLVHAAVTCLLNREQKSLSKGFGTSL